MVHFAPLPHNVRRDEMKRSLRITRRPFIAIGIVLSPVAAICLFALVRSGFRSDLVLPALLPFALYAVLMFTICSKRVSVAGDGITISSYFLFGRFIPFNEIDHSEVQILAERDHPAFIAVNYKDGAKHRTLSLSLKPYHKEDVAWFCALPEIKARTFAGLTKSA